MNATYRSILKQRDPLRGHTACTNSVRAWWEKVKFSKVISHYFRIRSMLPLPFARLEQQSKHYSVGAMPCLPRLSCLHSQSGRNVWHAESDSFLSRTMRPLIGCSSHGTSKNVEC